jgi:hypothetical protein
MLSNGYKIQETFSVFKEQVHQDLFFVKAWDWSVRNQRGVGGGGQLQNQ